MNVHILLSISTGYVGGDRKEAYDIHVTQEEWDAISKDGQKKIIDEMWRDFISELDGAARVATDEEIEQYA